MFSYVFTTFLQSNSYFRVWTKGTFFKKACNDENTLSDNLDHVQIWSCSLQSTTSWPLRSFKSKIVKLSCRIENRYFNWQFLQILNKHIDVLHPRDKYISIPSALFLHHLRCFLQHALCRLHLTPDQARSKELHYRQFWRDQKRSIEDSDGKKKYIYLISFTYN